MCSKNTWGEVSTLNLPGWQHTIFSSENTVYSPHYSSSYFLHVANAAFEGGSRGIVIRICSKNTWGRVSALNHPGWQHNFFKKTEFSLSPKNKGKALGTKGSCQSSTALLRWVTSIYRPHTQKQRRHMSLPEIFSVLSGPFTSHRVRLL